MSQKSALFVGTIVPICPFGCEVPVGERYKGIDGRRGIISPAENVYRETDRRSHVKRLSAVRISSPIQTTSSIQAASAVILIPPFRYITTVREPSSVDS